MKAEAFRDLEKAARLADMQWKMLAERVLDAEREALMTHKICLYTPNFEELLAAIAEMQRAATAFQMYYHASITDVSAVDP